MPQGPCQTNLYLAIGDIEVRKVGEGDLEAATTSFSKALPLCPEELRLTIQSRSERRGNSTRQ